MSRSGQVSQDGWYEVQWVVHPGTISGFHINLYGPYNKCDPKKTHETLYLMQGDWVEGTSMMDIKVHHTSPSMHGQVNNTYYHPIANQSSSKFNINLTPEEMDELFRLTDVNPTPDPVCYHKFKKYTGFTKVDYYCTKCTYTKDELEPWDTVIDEDK